jgi:hypothetical protein
MGRLTSSTCLLARRSMNLICPQLRRAALLGALLLPVSFPAVSPAAVGGGDGGGPPGASAHYKSGSAGGPYGAPGHNRQIVFQFRRLSSSGTRGQG